MAKVDTGSTAIPTSIARIGQAVRIGGIHGYVDGVKYSAGQRRVTATGSEAGHHLLEILDKSKRATRNGTRGWYGVGAYVDGMRIPYAPGTRTGCS